MKLISAGRGLRTKLFFSVGAKGVSLFVVLSLRYIQNIALHLSIIESYVSNSHKI